MMEKGLRFEMSTAFVADGKSSFFKVKKDWDESNTIGPESNLFQGFKNGAD